MSAVLHDYKYLLSPQAVAWRHSGWRGDVIGGVIAVAVMAVIICAAVFSEYRVAIAKWYLLSSLAISFVYVVAVTVKAVRS